ncbi:MAG: metal-responsive CopG/Arc/MetJ family transcriptional regulator [Yoonia sp.]|jgi:metal-responsive CopG/Arc/MetJ family transcriptional regulator
MTTRGRPKTTKTVPMMVRVSDELVHSIDEARKNEDDLPSRPEMIRRMIENWLQRHDSQ